ncbi:NAD-dependent epimerase/dehydratase family protein [Sporichthya polymorpha]|uniref:NAD-dependent epimerase/dehydratase family protein n=1 Tax=Sporichthya polymorpha TaxID=35751 RepID=UPI0003706A36|nr:NAD-dependent epimerase/dehydratase family protein [Sporichthya polymorpha]
MRILITGVSGLVGLATARRLVGAGHDVLGVSRSAPLELPRGARHRSLDVRDADGLREAAAGVDAILHCAFMLDDRAGADAMTAVNLTGTANVLAAAEATGARRVVFLSSSTVYGGHPDRYRRTLREADGPHPHPDHPYAHQKIRCEQLLAEATERGLETLAVRSGVILGRGTDNRLQEALAAPAQVAPPGALPWQLIHHDDLARFLVGALEPGAPTGVVNVVAPDGVPLRDLAAALGRPAVPVPTSVLRKATKLPGVRIAAGELEFAFGMPQLDTTRLTEEFGFTPAWSSAETAEDTRLAVMGRSTFRGRVRALPGRTGYDHQVVPDSVGPADGAPLAWAADNATRGQFDTPVDPRFPVYSQTNLSEALPGPCTPLTIDVQGRGLRGTTTAVARLLGLPEPLRTEACARLQAVHGHCFYINASGTWQLAAQMPGTSPDALADQWVGRHVAALPGGKAAIPGTWKAPAVGALQRVRSVAGAGVAMLALAASVQRDVAELRRQVARLTALADRADDLPPERLALGTLLATDVLAWAWTVQGQLNLVSGAVLDRAGSADGPGGAELPSAATLRGVTELARTAARTPGLLDVLTDVSPGRAERVRQQFPAFWAEVTRALQAFGHRGPGEAELSSRRFGDDVDRLLATVGRAARSVSAEAPHTTPGRRSPLRRYADHLLHLREDNRDLTVRVMSALRRLALAQGARMTAAGRLADPEDVFYLLRDELADPPADAIERVRARRAERDRLAALGMPAVFAGTWAARPVTTPLGAGESLAGIGIGGGKVRGRVRVVGPDTVEEFEPDEVLVAHVTDIGYTALFGYAAAVVTDLGGLMSHAALVAREYGVPCVVDTQEASERLVTGALVEVDADAGTVTMLESATAADGTEVTA